MNADIGEPDSREQHIGHEHRVEDHDRCVRPLRGLRPVAHCHDELNDQQQEVNIAKNLVQKRSGALRERWLGHGRQRLGQNEEGQIEVALQKRKKKEKKKSRDVRIYESKRQNRFFASTGSTYQSKPLEDDVVEHINILDQESEFPPH